ncbi:MAG: hypothetical protein KatS3mg002_0122 [Candidatus Woesearchaeota archaeon]|nr:MAG: hypothetical protein KatS3mg002_0122 [Candidatus Woesearchaeota archaeon]
MKRRVIKQGAGGYTIYLPKEWIITNKIKEKDELDIKDTDQGLIITPTTQSIKREITIKLKQETESRIRTLISSAYKRGYDTIILEEQEKDIPSSTIQTIIDSFLGLIISEQTEKTTIIKNILSKDYEDTGAVINKLFNTTTYFCQLSLDILQKKSKEQKEQAELKKSILKQRDYAQRAIALKRYEGDKSYEYYTIVFLLEKICGNFNYTIESQKTIKKETATFLQGLINDLNELKKSLTTKNLELAINMNEQLSQKRKQSSKHGDNTAVITDNIFSLSSRIVGVLV